MPNPFRRPGNAFHQPADWIAPGVGLIGKLSQERASGPTGNIAFIGDIGQGKTAALSQVVKQAGARALVLQYTLQNFSPEQALDLYKPIYNDLIDRLGDEAADAALKKVGLNEKTREQNLRRDQIMRLIEEIARASSQQGRPVHIVVDECQVPAEAFEAQDNVRKMAEWFESLQGLAETFRAGEGHVVIAITPSPWEQYAPRKVRDRFTSIVATRPGASEIQSFVEEGLKRAPDGPKRAASDLGAAILKSYEENVDITVRSLHERLHSAWERARRAAAEELTIAHIGP